MDTSRYNRIASLVEGALIGAIATLAIVTALVQCGAVPF